MAPLSIFRINGLAAADATQLAAFAGFLAMFSFLTLYMQNVLGYSPIQTGIAYLPVCFAIGIAAGISSQVLSRMGTRPVIVAGALISAGGIFWLSQIPVDGSCLTDLLPGMIVMWIGFGPVFEGVTTAANAGVPGDKAGLAASLVNAIRRVLDRFEGSEDSSLVTEALVDLLEWIDPGAQQLPTRSSVSRRRHQEVLRTRARLGSHSAIALRATARPSGRNGTGTHAKGAATRFVVRARWVGAVDGVLVGRPGDSVRSYSAPPCLSAGL